MLRHIAAAAAVTTFIAAPGLARADTTLTIGGTSQVVDTGQYLPPINLHTVLGGKYDDGPVQAIQYPADVIGMPQSVAIGADHLVTAIEATDGDKRALGISQGAIVIAEVKRRIMALPADQRPTHLTFVSIADPTRPGHGALSQAGYQTPGTPYDTTYITREYDGFADLPDRFNRVALMNAAAGIVFIHPYYGDAIPDDAVIDKTVNWAGGTNTDVLIHTPNLPMLQPLRDIGVDSHVVDAIQGSLKPLVDAGYSRNAPKPVKTAPVTTPTMETTPVKSANNGEDEVNPQVAKKPHRNIQASDATHQAPMEDKDDNNDKDDAKPTNDKPAEKPKPEKPVDKSVVEKPAEKSGDKGTDADEGTGAN